jgi:ATP-dependent Clp protease ATP-binding subunit ClpC
MGISLAGVRQQVEEIIGRGQQAPSGRIPFTPPTKKVLELSLREALRLGHNYVGTEHILLALIREGEGVAAQVLVRVGADLDRVRQQVIEVLAGRRTRPGNRAGRLAQWSAGADVAAQAEEIDRLHHELARLRDLRLRNGIQPGEEHQQTA